MTRTDSAARLVEQLRGMFDSLYLNAMPAALL
jgi:hypothetical protein